MTSIGARCSASHTRAKTYTHSNRRERSQLYQSCMFNISSRSIIWALSSSGGRNRIHQSSFFFSISRRLSNSCPPFVILLYNRPFPSYAPYHYFNWQRLNSKKAFGLVKALRYSPTTLRPLAACRIYLLCQRPRRSWASTVVGGDDGLRIAANAGAPQAVSS